MLRMDSLKQITQNAREEMRQRDDPEDGLEKIEEEDGEEDLPACSPPIGSRNSSTVNLMDKVGKKQSSNGVP